MTDPSARLVRSRIDDPVRGRPAALDTPHPSPARTPFPETPHV